MNNQRNNDSMKLEKKIMSGIKSGRIKLRSKYIFWAQKLGRNSAISLSTILAVLFFNLVLFYMKTTDNLGYLAFGKNGFLAFLESFPYLLVIGFVLFLLVAGYLITRTNWSYKKQFKYIILVLVGIVLITGGILASTDFSQSIEEQAFINRGPGLFFKPFLRRGMGMRDNGSVGEIDEIGRNYLIINTPQGKQYLDLSQFEPKQNFSEFKKGQLVIAIGKRKNDIFVVDEIRSIEKNKFLMIKRGIHVYPEQNPKFLHPSQNHFFHPNEEVKKCLDDCIEDSGFNQSCFEKCRPVK